MIGIKEIGKYNIDFAGLIYDGIIPYELIIIEEFDGNIPIQGSRKSFYIRKNIGNENKYIYPNLRCERDVENILQYPNNSRLAIYNKIIVERV